jgi:hypothetical protein
VVRPARKTVVASSPTVYLPALVWTPSTAFIPGNDRLVWQDSEDFSSDEGWVDTNFGIDERGNALFMDIQGRTLFSFGEITFGNGNVQVVDFSERAYGPGCYRLLNFADVRSIETVRMLAKADSRDSKVTLYLSK